MPGAIISLIEDLVEIMTHRSLSGSTSSSAESFSPLELLTMASISVVPFSFFTVRNCLRTSSIISAAALPTEIMVSAPKRKGSMAPTRTPARRMGSLTSKSMGSTPTGGNVPMAAAWATGSTFSLKAARRERAVSTADPTAKPLPMAAVVLPRASSESVLARTSGPKCAISARPPALSAIGPYASVESEMASVASIPTAEMATP
mmetsp:Transcript_12320/g.28917  ORF Transcript_12320/g.28917 Transcript_12320/m.28917 type:complete len:204 (-) Transcript_12320:852-1463(-)